MKRLVAGSALLLLTLSAQQLFAADVVRLGNLKFAHYGAVSYMKEICGKYNLKVEERVFPKGIVLSRQSSPVRSILLLQLQMRQ